MERLMPMALSLGLTVTLAACRKSTIPPPPSPPLPESALPAGLSADPVPLWRFHAGAPVTDAPVATPDRVFLATRPGRIFCLRTSDGTPLWSAWAVNTNNANEPETIEAPLLLAGPTLIAATCRGAVHGLDAASGRSNWTYEAGARIQGAPTSFAEPDGALRVVVLTQPSGILHALDPATGRPLWKSAETTRADGSPAAGDGRVVFGNCDAALHAFSARDGTRLGSVPLGPDSQVAGGIALDGSRAYSGSRSGLILCADMKAGVPVWTNRSVAAEIFTTPALHDRVLVAGARSGAVLCLERETGALRWSVTLDDSVQSPVIAGDTVVASAGGTVYLLDLADGKTEWSQKIADALGPPAVAGGRIFVAGQDGSVTAFRMGKESPR